MRAAIRVVPLLVVVLLAARPAAADDEACFQGAVDGQKLQRAGKLLDARGRFRACAQKTCDATVVEKCTGWLQEVELALPSLTIAVKDAAGHDVIPDHARLDDADASVALGGRSIPVDPGPHRLTVEVSGVTLSESVLVRQGEKDRPVVFHVGAQQRPAAAPEPEPTPGQGPLVGGDPQAPARGLLAGGIAAGGVALVSTILFATFGARGVSDRSAFGCANGCAADHYQSVHQDFVIADASLGVAIGSAVIMTVLFAVRSSSPKRVGTAGLAPLAGALRF